MISTKKLGLTLSLGVLAICSAHATDIFEETDLYKIFVLDGVPNLDQVRHATTVRIPSKQPLLGLPSDGANYCGPTSFVEWTAFLANRGFPKLLPGPSPITGSYTDGPTGYDQYNRVTLAIGLVSSNMHTVASGDRAGTSIAGVQAGGQQFLDAAYYGNFVTTVIAGFHGGGARVKQLVDASFNGNFIEIMGGFYHLVPDSVNPEYYRDNGHLVSLASATYNKTDLKSNLGIANPASGDSAVLQSIQKLGGYQTEPSTLNFVQVDSDKKEISGSSVLENVDYISKDNNWILDGAVSIQNLNIYSLEHQVVDHLNPFNTVHLPGYTNGRKTLTPLDSAEILYATRHPLTGALYYFTQYPYRTLRRVDPNGSGPVQVLKWTDSAPRQILFGAAMNPFALWGDAYISRMNLDDGAFSETVSFDMKVDRLAFDSVHDQIAAINMSSGQYFLLDHNLKIRGPLQGFTVPTGVGKVFTEFGPKGHLFVYQAGDSYVQENIPTTNGMPLVIWHFVPQAANADGFTVDDWGRQYFSILGAITVLDSQGQPVDSPFNGLAGGSTLLVNHSMNNYDPKVHTYPAWKDAYPAGIFSGAARKLP